MKAAQLSKSLRCTKSLLCRLSLEAPQKMEVKNISSESFSEAKFFATRFDMNRRSVLLPF